MAAPESEKTREQLVQEIKELRQRLAESGAVPVAERRKKENRISRKIISDAQHSSPKAVFTIDIEGRITRVSPEILLMSGYSSEELVGARHTLIFNQEIVPRSSDIPAGGFTNGKIFDHHRMEVIGKGGGILSVRVSAAPIYENGKLAGVVGVIEDIREQTGEDKEIERVYGLHREQEMYFRSLFELGNIGLAITSPEKGWLKINRAICEMLGYPESELLHKSWAGMTHPDDLEADIKQFNALLAGTIDSYELDKRFIRKDGTTVYTHLTVACQRKPDGEVDFVIASLLDISGRKQAEDFARVSHERFSTIFQQAPMGIALIDSHTGHIYEVNPRFAEIAGRGVEEMATIDWMSITHPDDVQEDLDNMALLNAGKIPGFQMDKRYLKPDGSIVWIRMTIAPLKPKQGISPRHLCMIDDITERKESETSLALSEARYRSLFERTMDYILVLEPQPDGPPIIIDANEAAFEKHGYTREEMIGKPISLLDREQSRDKVEERMRILASGKPHRFEARHTCKDGSLFTAEIVGQLISIGEKKIIYTIERDITERKQVDEALRRNEERIRAIADYTYDWESWLGPDGQLIWVNPAVENLTGYSTADCMQMADYPLPIVHEEERAEFSKILKRALAERGSLNDYNFRILQKEGSLAWMAISWQPIRDYQGDYTGLRISIRDVSERKQVEEQLQLFRNLIDQSNDAIFLIDPATSDFVDVNDTACSRLGYSREELLNMTVMDIEAVLPDRESWDAMIEVMREAKGKILEGTHIRKDGSRFPVEVSLKYVSQEDADYLVAAVRDVSERKLAENALHESEERYRAVVEDQTEVISRFRPDGTFVFVSDSYCKFFQVSRDEVLSGTWKMVAHDEDAAMVESKLAKLTPANPVVTIENRVHLPDGSRRWMEFVNRGFFSERGELIEIQSVGRDITDRMRAEEALKRSESNLKEAQEIARMGRWEFDIIENKLHWSDTIYEIFDIDKEQFGASYEAFLDAIHPDDIEAVNQAYSDSLRDKKPYQIEHRLLMRDGSIKWVSEQCRTDYDGEGRALRSVGVVQDITERKLAENALQTSLRLSEFALMHSLNELLVRTLDEAEALTGSQIGFFHFLEDDQETLQLQAWSTNTLQNMCTAEGNQKHYPVAEAGVWADCIALQKAVIHNDYVSLPNKKDLPEGHTPIIREMVIPIVRGGKIKAVIGVGNKPSDYDQGDIDNVSGLFNLSWDIIESKLAERELAEKMHQIERFNEFAVGRELEMLRLKDEVNSLLEKLGRQRKYEAPDRVRQGEIQSTSGENDQGEENEPAE